MTINDDARAWRRLLTVSAIAICTLVLCDLLLGLIAPPHPLREIDDAISQYARDDPDVLVLGSSHARSFIDFDALANELTHGETRILPVPLEYGKFTGYEWVLEHRLRPLIEECGPDCRPVRPRLRDLLLIGEWWDAIAPDEGRPANNLPARAWTLRDFAADVWRNGFTPHNENYLQQRWRVLFSRSSLVQDHGHGRIVFGLKQGLKRMLGREYATPRDRPTPEQLSAWRRMIEDAIYDINDPEEWAACERIFAYGKSRGLRVAMLLYPRMPSSISDAARDGTFRAFAERMERLCRRYDVRLIDWSWATPLEDEHFAADIDHATPEGSALLALWGLEHDLAYLLNADEPSRSEARVAR